MIIVEGVDNSGKTTLVNQLSQRFGLPTIHSPGPRSAEHLKIWIDTSFKFPRNVIFDRHSIISETVFGPAIRGSCLIDQEQLNRLAEFKPMILWCVLDIKSTLDTWGDRVQMDGVKENLKKLIVRYGEVMEKLYILGARVLPYCWKEGEEKRSRIMGLVDDYLNHHKES